jgi:DNA-directed RNA polymerase subunit RPC12/RpoP
MGKQVLFVCDECGYQDEYDEDYDELECPFCKDGRLRHDSDG